MIELTTCIGESLTRDDGHRLAQYFLRHWVVGKSVIISEPLLRSHKASIPMTGYEQVRLPGRFRDILRKLRKPPLLECFEFALGDIGA